MSAEDKAALYDEMMAAKASQGGPPRYKVLVSNNTHGDRTLFSSVSENRARKYVEDRCPRGQHFFVRSPDGTDMSYEHERHTGGPQGEDVDVWQAFDRAAYQAPTLEPVNSNDPWADAWEGAQ
jgi:hypothetical protein